MLKLLFILLLTFLTSDQWSMGEIHIPQKDTISKKYQLQLKDTHLFRRAYHGHENMDSVEWSVYRHRNPEPMQFGDVLESPYSNGLEAQNFLDNGDLVLDQFDTIADEFSYQYDPNTIFNVKVSILDYKKNNYRMGYALQFDHDSLTVLRDTLFFDDPTILSIAPVDLNNDGRQEIMTLYNWYIINGDNFDVNIYELEELPE